MIIPGGKGGGRGTPGEGGRGTLMALAVFCSSNSVLSFSTGCYQHNSKLVHLTNFLIHMMILLLEHSLAVC